jgi:6-pyruvoyltetrahydropterin/6-carboxytetrahydropterin synthase
MYYLTVESHFSSAHQLREYEGKCENLHGHNFRVELTVRGERLNSIGLLIDFNDIKKALKEVMNYIDHKNLNDLPEFAEKNPSSENLAEFIFFDVENKLQEFEGVETYSVTVFESETSRCTYKKN